MLAVVGAGHLAGLARHLAEDSEDPAVLREQLEFVQQRRRIPWITLGILAVVVAGIAIGFWRGGMSMGTDLLLQWTLYTGGLAAFGALLAGSRPAEHPDRRSGHTAQAIPPQRAGRHLLRAGRRSTCASRPTTTS